jgi:hypothetical protein
VPVLLLFRENQRAREHNANLESTSYELMAVADEDGNLPKRFRSCAWTVDDIASSPWTTDNSFEFYNLEWEGNEDGSVQISNGGVNWELPCEYAQRLSEEGVERYAVLWHMGCSTSMLNNIISEFPQS